MACFYNVTETWSWPWRNSMPINILLNIPTGTIELILIIFLNIVQLWCLWTDLSWWCLVHILISDFVYWPGIMFNLHNNHHFWSCKRHQLHYWDKAHFNDIFIRIHPICVDTMEKRHPISTPPTHDVSEVKFIFQSGRIQYSRNLCSDKKKCTLIIMDSKPKFTLNTPLNTVRIEWTWCKYASVHYITTFCNGAFFNPQSLMTRQKLALVFPKCAMQQPGAHRVTVYWLCKRRLKMYNAVERKKYRGTSSVIWSE